MKKFLSRILGIVLILFFAYQQFSYADVIDISPTELYFVPLIFLVGFISVIILVVSAISFFSLKATVKKQNMTGYDTISPEEIEKKKNRIQRRVFMWVIILSIIILIYLGLNGKISAIIFVIPVILFIVSIIVGLDKNKKVSNIICGISVGLVCIIVLYVGLSNKMIENYNKQFLQYEKRVSSNKLSERYVFDVEGLINTVIKNNKNDRKITIIYENTNYTSPEELKQLLSKLDTDKIYCLYIEYDNKHEYIESIILNSISNITTSDSDILLSYAGSSKDKTEVNSLFFWVQIINSKNSYPKVKINNIIYTSETGHKTTINFNTDKDEKLKNLRYELKITKTYKVEFQVDSNYEWNIIITTNN